MPFNTPLMLMSMQRFHAGGRLRVIGVERERHDAGIVDEYVDAAKALHRATRESVHLIELRHVRNDTFRGATRADDVRRHCVELRGIDIRAHEFAAEHRSLFADEATKAAGGARDDDDFVFDVVRHESDSPV